MRFTKPISGVELPELSNPAGASNIQVGYEAIGSDGEMITGTGKFVTGVSYKWTLNNTSDYGVYFYYYTKSLGPMKEYVAPGGSTTFYPSNLGWICFQSVAEMASYTPTMSSEMTADDDTNINSYFFYIYTSNSYNIGEQTITF